MINFDMNWYDVMRQIIDDAVDGKYKSQTSMHRNGKQYMVEATYKITELHFQNEIGFVPQNGGTQHND